MNYRIGHAHDVHRFGKGRELILGGVKIPYEYGLIGHSDADCVYHAVSEAIIGALGLGDLGTHFPDNDPKYKDMDSRYFLSEARKLLENSRYQISNLDITVYLEKPILKPYVPSMKENISRLLGIDLNQVNLKATRGEGMGFIGRGEGVGAECVVLIYKEEIIKKLL
ncbi:MAG: 2-C-methyl-D-erythritol 2,4-cyclodiphosphate synthase [Bacilli bacterium]|jgi:2-C-methyl-D-erythritol 2,4-cyclodiphosphate synthase